jgi:hypothetical protein
VRIVQTVRTAGISPPCEFSSGELLFLGELKLKTSTLDTALAVHDLGLVPVIVKAGEKGPCDTDWQAQKYERNELIRRYGNKPDLNVGILLGDIIDIEGDGENAEAEFAELFAGYDVPAMPSWQSNRGIHRAFEKDARLTALGTSNFKHGSLEFRIGGDGHAAQSLLPPSTTDGVTRDWIVPLTVDNPPAKLPEEVVNRILVLYAASKTADQSKKRKPKALDRKRPGDDFCQRATWEEILSPHGWTQEGSYDGVRYWKRPGKTGPGLSATTGHCESEAGRELFFCFSTNAAPFEAGKSYNKFGAYAMLNHNGDFSAASAALAEKGYGRKKPATTSSFLISLVAQAELFRSPSGDAYATVVVDGHHETYPVLSTAFKRYLEYEFFKNRDSAASGKALTEATGVIAAKARYQGKELPVFTRVAPDGEQRIFLDLCNDSWEAIVIDADGWRIDRSPSVKFRRPNGMLALPSPQPGDIEELRRFVNVDDDSWPLLVCWLVMALCPGGPYPIMLFNSEHGSCKSTTARVCRQLIDPNVADLRSAPDNQQIITIAAANGWIVALDNVSKLLPWLSDALCRISTGGGMGTRTLYTNGEETLFNVQRPALVTGIGELTRREDFLDRVVLVRCPAMPDDKRRDEKSFYADFESARPRILGALLTAASAALRNLPNTKLDCLPRMGDFAKWATAAETGFGWEPGTFLRAYERNRAELNEAVLDQPIVDGIRTMLSDDKQSGVTVADGKRLWRGSATDLMDALKKCVPDSALNSDDWPRSGNVLSSKVNRLTPNLRKAGITVNHHRREFTFSMGA